MTNLKEQSMQELIASLDTLEAGLTTAKTNIELQEEQIQAHVVNLNEMQEQVKTLDENLATNLLTVEEIVAISEEQEALKRKISAQKTVIEKLNSYKETLINRELTPVAVSLLKARADFRKYNKQVLLAVSINELKQFSSEMKELRSRLSHSELLFHKFNQSKPTFRSGNVCVSTGAYQTISLDQFSQLMNTNFSGSLSLDTSLFIY